jgi:histidyl-tRNA synthetase
LLPEAKPDAVDVAIVVIGDKAADHSLAIADAFRRGGCSTIHCGGGATKRQFKIADREQARFVAVIGEDEMHQQHIQLKDMQSGTQQALPVEAAIAAIMQGHR